MLAASLPRPVWQSIAARWLATAAAPGEPLFTLVQMLNGTDKIAPGTRFRRTAHPLQAGLIGTSPWRPLGLNVEMTDVVGRWRENACVLLANRPAGYAVALQRLADTLLRSGRAPAAHVWYDHATRALCAAGGD